MIALLLLNLSVPSIENGARPLVLEPLPEESELFITSPRDLHIDERGWLFILDQGIRRILVWDERGRFQGTRGQPGQGPGELSFLDHQHPHASTISRAGDRWIVYDDGSRAISEFDSGWTFLRRTGLELESGGPLWARAIGVDRFLIRAMDRQETTSHAQLGIHDAAGKLLVTLLRMPNPMLVRGGERPALMAFSPQLIGRYDAMAKQIIVGFGAETRFSLHEPDGELVRTIDVAIPPARVTAAEQNAFRERNRDSFGDAEIHFPEEHPHYSDILAVGRRGFLVYRQDYLTGAVTGMLIDREGKRRAPFRLNLGGDGKLLGSRGRILAVSTDEDGEYLIYEVLPPLP